MSKCNSNAKPKLPFFIVESASPGHWTHKEFYYKVNPFIQPVLELTARIIKNRHVVLIVCGWVHCVLTGKEGSVLVWTGDDEEGAGCWPKQGEAIIISNHFKEEEKLFTDIRGVWNSGTLDRNETGKIKMNDKKNLLMLK